MFTDPFEDEISVAQAAALIGVSRPTVYRLIERGVLEALPHPVTGRRRVSRLRVLSLLRPEGSPALAVEPSAAERVAEASAVYVHGTPSRPVGRATPSDPAGRGADSLFHLPDLGLDFGVADLSERIDYYRSHGLREHAQGLFGHVGAGGDEQPERPLAPGGDA